MTDALGLQTLRQHDAGLPLQCGRRAAASFRQNLGPIPDRSLQSSVVTVSALDREVGE